MPDVSVPGSQRFEADRFDTLRVDVSGHVGRVTLNRPDRLNAFTPQMWAELRAVGQTFVADSDDIRALVVCGAGRAFSSGIDTSVFGEGVRENYLVDDEPPRHEDPTVAAVLATQEAYTWLAEAPFVTIAAVQGYALGAGLQLALACDLRVASRSAQLGLLELRYGILPDLGGTQRLPRLVGPGKALELITTAAMIDAEEGYRIGLVERVVDDEALDEEVDALAAAVAAQPPLAVRGTKRAVQAALDGRSVREGLLVEAEAQAVCLTSSDFAEAIAAFVAGRSPVYRAE